VQADNTLTATSDLVRRDSGIPGLGLLLDPARLLAEMRGQVDVARVEDIRLEYLRYKPGMNCLARYALRVDGAVFNAYAKAHGQDAVAKLGKSMERTVSDGVLGPGRVALEDFQLIFSTFPNDAKLASLHCLVDDDFRQGLFGRLFGRESQWRDCSFGEGLNYKPERRYVTRLFRSDGESALAKFYSRAGYAKARMISRKLGRGGFCPETIGRSKKHQVVAYHWQPGTTLRQLHIDGKLPAAELVAVAESLAGFNASKCDGLSPSEPGGQTRRLLTIAEQVGILLPQLDQRARRLAQSLAEWLAGDTAVRKPVHGDFYDKQAIMSNGRVRLIDLDAARLDNPLVDIGNYLAHLERRVVGHAMTRTNVEVYKETLIDAFERLNGSVPGCQLDRYIALGLFGLIHQPFRDWKQDWPVQTEQLLERVETLLAA